MKTKKTNTKSILIILVIVIAFLIGIPFGYGIYHGIKSHTGVTGAIEKTLTENCNCDVAFEFSSVGIQVSKEDGINGKTIVFNFKNYNLTTPAREEAARLHEILKTEVEGYEEIDLVTLQFVSEKNTETVKIKKGQLL